MKPIIKWPGGKTKEIGHIKELIPDYKRYVEPFFGGGALFFHLAPKDAAINDISASLIQFYSLIKAQDRELYNLLMCYNDSFRNLITVCNSISKELLDLFFKLNDGAISSYELRTLLETLISQKSTEINAGFNEKIVLDQTEFYQYLQRMTEDKFVRTVVNHNKNPFSASDLSENLITGFTSGYYMYFRKVYNDISTGCLTNVSTQYQAANFYFIREFCYGSMFRYNANG